MDTESVREDLGYMKYDLDKSDTYKGRADKIKVEYIQGLMLGRTAYVKRNIAEDLIKRGYAKEVQ